MANKEGDKTGGRTKGTPNKTTQELMDIADKLECNPFEVLIHFAKGDFEALGYPKEKVVAISENGEEIRAPSISPELRQKSAKDACEFLFPKRKAIEHTGKDGEKLSIEQFLKLEDMESIDGNKKDRKE